MANYNPSPETRFGAIRGNTRSSGAWKKEDTARYKLEKMLVLTAKELVTIANDKNAPMFERRVAQSLLKENDFKTTEAMINQVYGVPKQIVEQTNIEIKPILPKGRKE